LPAARDQFGQGLPISVGGCARFGTDAFSEQGDDLGIKRIGLGEPACGTGEIRIWRGLTTAIGRAAPARAAATTISNPPVASSTIGPDIRPRIAMTDKGYDSQATGRRHSRAASHRYSAPRNSKRRGASLPKRLYKLRARVEQAIGKLNGSNAWPCPVRRPTPATQQSSVLPAG
jgi:hypothetical protein